MTTLSAPPSHIATSSRSTPRVVHGLVYGIGASMAMWGAIAAIAYKLI
ncbi:hypothetical protein SAMN05428984_2986 [Sphingomonas sp. OK281]|nr:hypothetical protein SAMN05428984_2986 [Sphingomonas sp. OK281]